MNDSFDYLKTSLLGVCRGIFVHTFTHPIEVVKINLQATGMKTHSIIGDLFQKEGFKTFYRGICSQWLKTSIKQSWCWPTISALPKFFANYHINIYLQQAFTGISIAFLDAIIGTPLERRKFQFVTKSTAPQFALIFKKGWHGFFVHFAKLTVSWSTFLTSQKFFRETLRREPQEKLSIQQLTKAGIQVAIVVSVAMAPFDFAHTFKQIDKKHAPFTSFSSLYRGWHLNALSLIIHNIASIFLLEILNN